MIFLKKNWKSLFYPLAIIFIISFDQILGFSAYFTLLKVLIFSVVHAFVVHKNKYIYDSEIYIHYASLRKEYESNFIFEPILSEKSKKALFILIFSLTLFLCIIRNNIFSGKAELGLILCILSMLFIFDALYEFMRTITNKTDFTKVKSKIPDSIRIYGQQRRTMYSFVLQKLIQHGPTCVNGMKVFGAGVGFVEIGYPEVFANEQLGPLTKLVANKIIYKNEGLEYPIQTKQDMIYESHKKIIEGGVVDGSRDHNDMPKRTFSFCSEVERNEFLVKNRIIK